MSVLRKTAVIVSMAAIIGGGRAYAQDATPAPGKVEVTLIPAGTTFFTDHNQGTKFSNYDLGGSLTYNINRVVGIEGELSGSLGRSQTLMLNGLSTSGLKTPNMLTYTGNVVVSVPTHASVVPYATGGIGGLSMFQRPELGVTTTDTFLTGNVGGGVKWYAPNGRWGLRGDYRFMATRSNATAPTFFGPADRFGHRIYGAVVINAVR